MEVAMRLYADLTRSHIEVWRDQIDGDPTADFLEEFLGKIDECDDFMILDSKNYRMKSNWCLTEIERCFENRAQRNGPRIIVCLLDEDGEWRYSYTSKKHEELFSKVNMFKYHTLYYKGKYDNENVYHRSIKEICALFSERFVPWNDIPQNRDLVEELVCSNASITDIDRKTILSGYEYIVQLAILERDVDKHFQLWISDCEYYKLHLFFPRWTYCIWLGHDMHYGKYDSKCLLEFEKLAVDFPNDPRCFRGIGCIASKLDKYDIAITAFKKALELMEEKDNLWHKVNSKFEVLSNLGQVYINTNQIDKAIDYLFEAYSIMKVCEIFELRPILNLVYCLISMGRLNECKTLLMEIIREHPLESELYSELGSIYSVENDNDNAIKCYEHAYSLAPSVQNAFYLLCRKSENSNVCSEISTILKKEINCLDDYYWKGAICYYLLNDIKEAKLFYNRSRCIYEWYQ